MTNTRKIILSTDDSSVQLDVNPPELTLEFPHDINERALMGGGYLELGKSGLRRFTLETFLTSGMDVGSVIESLKRWKSEGQRIRVDIDPLIDNEEFLLVDMGLTVKEGDLDVHIKLVFYEYLELEIEQVSSAKVVAPLTFTPTDGFPKKYTVVKGDNLYKIAKKHYPSGNYWKKIYEENRSVIGANPNLIRPGQQYTLSSVTQSDKSKYG